MRVHLTLTLAMISSLAAAWPAGSAERVLHLFDERSGLDVAETSLLAQDARGFIWIGTIGGLYRFDGEEVRAWAADDVRHVVKLLAAGPAGEVVVAGEDEPLREVSGLGVTDIPGPHGAPIHDWVDAVWTDDGALWIATADTLWRRPPVGGERGVATPWQHWPAAAFGEDRIFRVHARGHAPGANPRATGASPTSSTASVYLATRRALWWVDPHGPTRSIGPIPAVIAAGRRNASTDVVLSAGTVVWTIRADGAFPLRTLSHAAADLVVRDGTIWVSQGRGLTSIAVDGTTRTIPPRDGVPPGRPLLVDHEGTLWIGGLRGLVGLPEPGTVAWNERDGLPDPPHAHHLARGANDVWVVTWFGSVRLEQDEDSTRIVPIGSHSGRIRPDPAGRMWAADLDAGFVCWEGRRAHRFARPGVHGLYGTSHRRDGRMWMSTDDGIFLTPDAAGVPSSRSRRGPEGRDPDARDGDAQPPRFLDVPPPAWWSRGWSDCWLEACLESSTGRFFVGHGEEILSCDAESLAAGRAVSWTRHAVEGAWIVNDLIELPGGEVWAGTGNAGVLRLHQGHFEPIPGNRELSSLRVYGLVPSPSGGAWILAAGSLVRVVPRRDHPDGWEIVERLGPWQGVPTAQASDLCEDGDGRLWLASLAGVVEVPPRARQAPFTPPAVELVDLRVDGAHRADIAELRLPWHQNRLEVHFAALSFRQRSLLRYQHRLQPDAPWQPSSEPVFRFVQLAPGHYDAEVRASLDGVHWTSAPGRLRFAVAPPWWRTPVALAGFVVVGAGLLILLHRARIAVLLQLERQRAHIARDLHDEIGSGLGSIGILAGLAADASLDEERRRMLSHRIGETSTELGGTLGGIVASLEQGADTLESFALRLAELAGRMVPGDAPRLALALPDRWPTVRLTRDVQKELRAIAAEALHNAMRHAQASTVTVAIVPERDHWRLIVRDDGVGLPPHRALRTHSGHGLANMEARARTIDATVSLTAPPTGGTEVSVRFRPVPRRLRMMMRAPRARRSAMLRP